jgi:outer membrane protein assembly factor BamB
VQTIRRTLLFSPASSFRTLSATGQTAIATAKILGHLQLVLLTCVLVATSLVSSAQTPLGLQITPDHAGALFSLGMDPPLTVKWSIDVGGTASYPIITGGKVFVIGGGSPSGLYALDGQTGHIIWTQPSPPNYGGWVGAAYDNGVLFVVSQRTPGLHSGAMFAFSAADGHLVWSANLPGQYSFSSAPTASNGIVYTGGAGSGGTVYAVRESDGLVLWTASVENGDSSAPAVTSDGVYVSYACPQTYRFNPMTGQQIWHYSGSCEGGGGETAVVYQGLVYVRDVFNYYLTDGITLSTANGLFMGGFNSKYSPVFWRGSAFYTEPDTLTAVDVASSRTLWTDVAHAGENYSCAPILVNGVVYAGTSSGNLYGYASDTGNNMFSLNLGQPISCSEYSSIPLAGMSAGDGLLVVPAGSEVVALQFDAWPLGAWQFVPVPPCRLVDTRPQYGGSGPIPGGTFQDFYIPHEGGCNIPTTAAAYSLNVSVVPSGRLSYLTIWPTGEYQPVVATLNSIDGRIKANAAIVPAGYQGGVSIYVTETTNVILDINGYFAPASGSTFAFYPLTPCRVADTRHSTYPPGLGPPSLTGGQERAFPILNATTTCNIPSSGVAAYSLNFSVVPHGSLGYLTVWPTGESRPTVSTLNDVPGTIIANAAIVTAGTSGDVSVYPSSDTDLVIDINGYFAPPGPGGLSLYPAAPCRVIDTRHVGSGQPFSGTLSPPVDVVGSACGVPSTAQAYVFNASVVPTGGLGYLTLWPDGSGQPLVSTLNALDGSISSNMAIVPSTNGKVDAYASGITQLILDISSYFAP